MGKGLKGQLLLTNRRVIFIKYSGGTFLTKSEDYSSRIDEGLQNEGSLEIPLDMILEAAADRMWGTPYFRLRYRTPEGEQACSFTFSKVSKSMAAGGLIGLALATRKSPYDKTADLIDQLRTQYSATQDPPSSPYAAGSTPADALPTTTPQPEPGLETPHEPAPPVSSRETILAKLSKNPHIIVDDSEVGQVLVTVSDWFDGTKRLYCGVCEAGVKCKHIEKVANYLKQADIPVTETS